MKFRLPHRHSPVYNLTFRSRSGRVLDPISQSPVTGGLMYGRRARDEALRRLAAERDVEVVSVRRRSLADSRIARSAARDYRRSQPRVPERQAWEFGPDAYRPQPAPAREHARGRTR